ncbi:hypothetical protein N0V90_008373 [Kalmusia sp. IMI 367209]|nr:hypothetical protein N0V90_008373 [Kalmusia sp. IMI 367209]
MESLPKQTRDESSYFDSHSYYRFHHPSRPNKTLSITDSSGTVDMVDFRSSSYENWQIYYQHDRWFIRPYATADDQTWTNFQLGLIETSGNIGALPSLLERSGTLGQQWKFTRVDDDNGGYGYKMSNELSGNQSWLSLTGTGGRPGMQSSSEGLMWEVEINPEAKAPEVGNSYQDVDGFVVATSSSASASTSTIPSTSSSTLQSTFPPIQKSNDSSSAPLGTGAIVGIAVGVVVLVVLAITGAYFFYSKRRKTEEVVSEPELNERRKAVYVYNPVEIGSEPVMHMAQESGYEEPRYELGNDPLSVASTFEGSAHRDSALKGTAPTVSGSRNAS